MERFIPLKTSRDVDSIRISCRIASETLAHLYNYIKPGISTVELERIASDFIRKRGAVSAVENHFPGAICTSINQVVAHGIPSGYRLKVGDILTVDVAVSVSGWYGDAAWSYVVGHGSSDSLQLYNAARKAVLAGVHAVRTGERIGDIGAAVLRSAKYSGCTVIEEFVGHGIGQSLHEEPDVPHVGKEGEGIRIAPGMVITVEPAVSLGSGGIRTGADGWTMMTADGSKAAQFEHTVAVFRDYTEVLTVDFPLFF